MLKQEYGEWDRTQILEKMDEYWTEYVYTVLFVHYFKTRPVVI